MSNAWSITPAAVERVIETTAQNGVHLDSAVAHLLGVAGADNSPPTAGATPIDLTGVVASALNALVSEQVMSTIPEQARQIATALDAVAMASMAYDAADSEISADVSSAVARIDWVDAQCAPVSANALALHPNQAALGQSTASDVLPEPGLFDPSRFSSRIPRPGDSGV